MWTDHRRHRQLGSLVPLAAFAALLLAGAGQVQAQDEDAKPYIIKDGKVDFGTYNGYRRYDGYCLRCHGPDGAGSSYAPALIESLKRLDHDTFVDIVVNGRKNVSSSQQSVMPAFGYVEDVMLYLEDIYAYLKARSDGEIGRGRPQRLPPEDDPVFQERRSG
jgi:methanol metabolism-related c-type cytochrome